MDLEKFCINKNSTILQALNKLNDLRDVSRLTLFVFDENKKIIDSLTDGDIRRSLISGFRLSDPILNILKKDFNYILHNKNTFVDFSKYKNESVKIIPVLDDNFRLIKIYDSEHIKSILPIEAVIMAGGRGKRLSPLTDNKPKPLLEVGGIPILERNILNLKSYGISKIYLTVNYLSNQIKEYFGNGEAFGVKIIYIEEEHFLGTAGSLSLIKNVGTPNLLIMNADLLTNVNLLKIYNKHIKTKAEITISTIDYSNAVPFAVFERKQGKINSLKEKPTFRYEVNAGIYIIKSKNISKVPKNNYYDMTSFITSELDSGGLVESCQIEGYWIDIGNPQDYKKANIMIGG